MAQRGAPAPSRPPDRRPARVRRPAALIAFAAILAGR